VAEVTGRDLEAHRCARVDRASAVSDLRAVKGIRRAIVGCDFADAARLVECCDGSGCHCTILAMGSSRMPVAPWSFSAGIKVLMSDLATTVSTA